MPVAALTGFHHLGALDASHVAALAARGLELRSGAEPTHRSGRLGLLFLNPSLRTQASFQAAAARLGLDVVQLAGNGIWGLETRDGVVMDSTAAEHVKEAAAVLGRYVDVLGVRAFAGFRSLEADRTDPILNAFAEHAGIPVVNMESALWHPCQALADWITLEQLAVPRTGKLVLTWAWHPKPLPHAVPNSTLCMAAQRGMEVVLLHPSGFELLPEIVAEAERLAAAHGGSLQVTDDRESALRGADVVYAKSWSSQLRWIDTEAEAGLREPFRAWCVTPEWLASGAHFLHCLPIRRNVVASDAVLDGPASAVIDQAENRLHAQTALLEELTS